MAETTMPHDGLRVILRYPSGKVFTLWLPDADMVAALLEARTTVIRGGEEHPVRITLEPGA